MWQMLCALAGAAALGAIFLWLDGRRRCVKRLAECEARHARQRDELERATRTSDENLRGILASMAEGVVAVDRRRVIQLANPTVLKMFALKQDPAGQSVLSVLRLPLLETMMRTAIEEGTPQQEETTVQIVPGQNPAHLIVSTLPMGDPAKPTGAVTVIRDIS